MNLTYRGQNYLSSNTIATVNPQTTLTYRGHVYQYRSNTATVTPKAKLMYRGVPYGEEKREDKASEIATMMGFECHQVILSCPL